MLDKEIAVQLRRRGWDVDAIQEIPEYQGLDDDVLLRTLQPTGRVLVIDNAIDFAPLHAQFLAAGNDHAGLLFASPAKLPRSKRIIGLGVERLDALLRALGSEASMQNDCRWL